MIKLGRIMKRWSDVRLRAWLGERESIVLCIRLNCQSFGTSCLRLCFSPYSIRSMLIFSLGIPWDILWQCNLMKGFNAKGIHVYMHENDEMTSVWFEIVIQEKWRVIRVINRHSDFSSRLFFPNFKHLFLK